MNLRQHARPLIGLHRLHVGHCHDYAEGSVVGRLNERQPCSDCLSGVSAMPWVEILSGDDFNPRPQPVEPGVGNLDELVFGAVPRPVSMWGRRNVRQPHPDEQYSRGH